MEASGKKTVLVRKERPGFIVNRLMGAIEREIDYLLDEGIVTPEDLDIAIKSSTGFRFACLGPMEVEDMIGLDIAVTVSGRVFKGLSNATEPSPHAGGEGRERASWGSSPARAGTTTAARRVRKSSKRRTASCCRSSSCSSKRSKTAADLVALEEGGPVFDLTGKVAIVTGGGGGLGKPIAVALAAVRRGRGRRRARDVSHLEPVVKEIEALGRKALAVSRRRHQRRRR